MVTEKHLNALSVALFILVMGLARLLPHPENIAPIGALALFSGAYIQHRYQWLLPVAALLVGDLFLGGYNPVIMLGVYGGFAIGAIIARFTLHKRWTPARLASIMVINALVFYLLSNLGMWWAAFPHSAAGLVQCYTLAQPYLAKSLLGDALYTALVFGTAVVIQRLQHDRGTGTARL